MLIRASTEIFWINVSKISNNILEKITYSIVSYDKAITNYYTIYIDNILFNIIGNGSYNYGDIVSDAKYLYRNGVMGACHIMFTLNGSLSQPFYFYYNYSSTTNNLIVFRGFNHRVRSCPSGYNYY